MLAAIVALTRTLGIRSVAEGVVPVAPATAAALTFLAAATRAVPSIGFSALPPAIRPRRP